jgi:regulator of protease activity HflC (stomatin/prohibitin superfamily)
MVDLDLVSITVGIIFFVGIILFATGIVYVSRYEVGIKTKKIFGKKMPQGQVIARNDEIGIQADTLMPGLYWFNPLIWKIEREPITIIKEEEIGTIESIDGEPIPTGRLLGDAVDSNQFQDAKMFLDNGGNKGPQIAILRPGAYRINTRAFTVTMHPVTKIPEESIGIAVASDGQPLPSGYIIAPKPTNDDHKYYQNGPGFIKANGYRGPQLDTLQPGEYYINPLLFDVKVYEQAEVPPGYVAVLRSNIGLELAKSEAMPKDIEKEPSFRQEVHEKDEVVLTTDINQRGIWEKPIAPGIYNLNYLALTPFLVPTSAVTIDWAASTDIRTEEEGMLSKAVEKIAGRKVLISGSKERREPPKEEVETEKATEFFKFSQLTLTSKDGFILEADVRMIIRIRPQHASFIIARFGSVPNLIEQIVHPLIDSSFRNKAGEKKAIDFIQSRADLQKEALEVAREVFEKYYVEAQNLLISYIKVDPTLLKTQTDKEIAIQQQAQFKEQAAAQEENIVVQEKTARAQKQTEVIAATLSIKINEDKADARRAEARGESDAIKYLADGTAYQNRETGKGIADAYEAQAKVVGPERLALLKVMEQVATGKIQIVPNFLVSSGEKGDGGNLFNTWIATMLASNAYNVKKQDMKEPEK